MNIHPLIQGLNIKNFDIHKGHVMGEHVLVFAEGYIHFDFFSGKIHRIDVFQKNLNWYSDFYQENAMRKDLEIPEKNASFTNCITLLEEIYKGLIEKTIIKNELEMNQFVTKLLEQQLSELELDPLNRE